MAGLGEFWVKLWGVRGTVACPGPATRRFGGNTACVEVRCGPHRLILDAGTGLRVLGNAMAAADGQRCTAHIFLTHTHLDHVMGLPFFKPAYRPGNCFEFWAGHLKRAGHSLQEVLGRLMERPYFPVPLDIMHACIAFHDFEAGEVLEPFPDVRVRTAPLVHPGGATGYRIDYAGRSVCYVTDTEHPEHGHDQAVLALIEGAQIVIYDATYTDAEMARFRGWGHSTWEEGLRLVERAGAGRLVTFHHDPEREDTALDLIDAALSDLRPGSLVGREGMVLEP
jgi:phosphoribosyl 1,2-cyclic phosphodiesterase